MNVRYRMSVMGGQVAAGVWLVTVPGMADDCLLTTGTVFGSHATAPNAFDGNTSTYPDTATSSNQYCGLDLGEGRARQMGRVRFYPRASFPSRMTGGKFQGSNDGPTTGYVDIYTIPSTPPVAWTTVTNSPEGGIYRYFRYWSPTYGYLNVAEIEFYERVIGNLPATNVTGSSAWLNGVLASTGVAPDSPPAEVWVYYGPADEGTNWSSWATNHYFGPLTAPAFPSFQATDLAANAAYAYRFRATNALVDAGADSAATFTTAELWLTKTDASEVGLVRGTFTVHRAASAAGLPLTVNYQRTGGTAVTGRHIVAFSGSSVTLAAGATNATIVVVPLVDYQTVPDTTLEMALLPGPYRLGSSSAATMTILSAPTPSDLRVTGVVFGTAVNYANAFDGNTATTPDGPADGGYCGLDLGAAHTEPITLIRFYPRTGLPQRMTGGKFQGSNTGTSEGFTDFYTVPSTPPTAWTTITNTDSTVYRYVRYLSPNGGYCNVGEVEFYVRWPRVRLSGALMVIR